MKLMVSDSPMHVYIVTGCLCCFTGRAAKYTKDTDTIEVYPNDNNLYAIPDTAQHYETVRVCKDAQL